MPGWDALEADWVSKRSKAMKAKLNQIENIVAVIGVLLCVAAIIYRLLLKHSGLGLPYNAANIFIVGIGFMVAACLAKIEAK
jgi:peptidoglycan/LPS O-acetylase OafA/YrhL